MHVYMCCILYHKVIPNCVCGNTKQSETGKLVKHPTGMVTAKSKIVLIKHISK